MAPGQRFRDGCAAWLECDRRCSRMNMMLLAIFAAASVGIVVKGFGRREAWLCAGLAIALTALYFFRPYYMT